MGKFMKDLIKPFGNITHSLGKGFENVTCAWASTQKSIGGGIGSIAKGLSSPIVLIGIAGIIAFVLLRR